MMNLLFLVRRWSEIAKRIYKISLSLILFGFWYIGWSLETVSDSVLDSPYLRLSRFVPRLDPTELISIGLARMRRTMSPK
jgi:hypothetical protein